MFWRFAWGLRGYLKEPITLEQSSSIIRERLQNREKNFLLLVKRAIYENKSSPYLKLLGLSGCEYGDFEKMVRSDGIEPALKKLAGEGVYLSVEEFKGRKEIRRGCKIFQFKEGDFDNPFLSGHLETRSSASRSAGTRTVYDFDFLVANRAVYYIQMLDANNALELPFALWVSIMPGAGPMVTLGFTKAGKTPIRWFSPIQKRNFRPSLKNRMGTIFIVYAGRFWGTRLPVPEYVSLDEAEKVAEWMGQMVREKGGCSLDSFTSLGVRICQKAKDKGIDLTGVTFFLGGEPTTEAKRKEISAVGATACPVYIFTEGGMVGAGCYNPSFSDDIHLFKDSLALIQQKRQIPHAATTVEAFLFSTLLLCAPKILLNIESGDWGVVETRKCGCKLEKLGLSEHLHYIRGFDKLTSSGMTFIGTDLLRIIEEVLPSKFGGASTDYQMLEEEDSQGHTNISIIASPDLGEMDESEMIKTVLSELSKGNDSQRMMVNIWTQAHVLKVKRIWPYTTGTGKLIPLHIKK